MPFDSVRWFVSQRPGITVLAWVLASIGVFLAAPSLTQLAREGQAELLPPRAESSRAVKLLELGWPGYWYECSAVVGIQRPGGLTDADREHARLLSRKFDEPWPEPFADKLLGVIGPDSAPEIAERLVSEDGEVQLIIVPISDSFVSPGTGEIVDELVLRAGTLQDVRPEGLELLWTGEAILGRDYMGNVQKSLDRAAIVTVFLLMAVLLAVYRSFWLSMIPLLTIGLGLVISRGILAWMTKAGWEISPLVELFLIVLLFGCGTDYCLLLSWRFGENWNSANPAGALRTTMTRLFGTLFTSAATTIVGLSLMGTTRFKLFSSTGPSVAIGLGIIFIAAMTLTPALLLLLARHRPKSFAGLTAPPTGFWDRIGHMVLARPWLSWSLTILLMLPAAILGLRLTVDNAFVQDTLIEMPSSTRSIHDFHIVAEKFGAGAVAPLTVVLRAEKDLRSSEGLAMIDDVSRLLSHQRRLAEVRSATQPLGTTEPLEPARLASRLEAINDGFEQLTQGAKQLEEGLTEGGAKLRAAILLEDLTGVNLTGRSPAANENEDADKGSQNSVDPLTSGLGQAASALLGGRFPSLSVPAAASITAPIEGEGPREQMLKELTRAAQGARQIAEGAGQARQEISVILADPVGRRALDRLLITAETVQENPELLRSFEAYLSPDGRLARIDIIQLDRPMSQPAMEQVETIRTRLRDYLNEVNPETGLYPRAYVTGANAESADVRALTRRDQYQTWIIVPLGVFIILLILLRDLFACVNLVGTMVLTYAFSLGVTHVVFVWGFGYDGLDWKVPYFLFVLLVAVGVDYNVFLMTRLQEESKALGMLAGINRAIAQTGGLISSAAAITACSFSALMFSPLASLKQLGFSLVVGITIDAVLVRPLLVPCGQWLMNRHRERRRIKLISGSKSRPERATVPD